MIWPLNKIFRRNYAVADAWLSKMGQPVYTNWTVEKAVKEGYKSNGWVYRSVYLIAKAVAQVRWAVADKDGEPLDGHYLTDVFRNPNPYISRQDMMELVSSWLELAGNSYLYKTKSGGRTKELWPVSPDRLAPVPSKQLNEWIQGYALDKKNKIEFLPEDIVHHKFFNPANPLVGIAPLLAASRTTDIDNEQQNWNKAAMQNRGVVDGVMSFERNFSSQDEANAIRDKLNETVAGTSNARRIQVVGSNAKYTRMSLSPVEMDFENSRKFNREEIFIVFGVPPVYAGVTDAATLNNYKTSELIFWFQTIIPLLEDIKDTFNRSFSDELDGNSIVYDLSRVRALREAMLDWVKTAKDLFEMGVPFEQLNKVFEFGFDAFDGWEKSFVKVIGSNAVEDGNKIVDGGTGARSRLTLIERRDYQDEQDRISRKADGPVKDIFANLLKNQRDEIFKDVTEDNLYIVAEESQTVWEEELKKLYLDIGVEFGAGIILERKSSKEIMDAIELFLIEESIILTECSQIIETTVSRVLEQILDGYENGSSIAAIQQAIIDAGPFSESRALMLARTITGSAANIGQMTSAKMAGATHKTWRTAGFEVRKTHQAMQGVKVGINDTFSVGGETARYPGDNRLSPKEKCNCRCTLTYSVED